MDRACPDDFCNSTPFLHIVCSWRILMGIIRSESEMTTLLTISNRIAMESQREKVANEIGTWFVIIGFATRFW